MNTCPNLTWNSRSSSHPYSTGGNDKPPYIVSYNSKIQHPEDLHEIECHSDNY